MRGEKLSLSHRLSNAMYRWEKNIDRKTLSKNAKYLAALLDGEGHFDIVPQFPPLSFYAIITLGMTHKKTVETAADIFGVTTDLVERERPYRDYYVAKIMTQRECEQVCKELSKYSITKAAHIELLLEFLQLKKKLRFAWKVERKKILFRMIELHILCRKANERGTPKDFKVVRKNLREMVIKDIGRKFG
jgi:hypothetical protein